MSTDTTEQPVDVNAVPACPAPVEAAEPEVDDKGLPLDPTLRTIAIPERQNVAAAEAAEVERIAEHAERLRTTVLELRADGWTVTPPKGMPHPLAG